MNGSSTGLGKSDTVAICNYYSKNVSVANMEEAALTSHMKDKKHLERSPSDQCYIINATNICFSFDHIENYFVWGLQFPIVNYTMIIMKISLSGVWSFQ